jgi:CheY-like chemotaxis protein
MFLGLSRDSVGLMRKVLVVDDNPAVREVVSEIVSNVGLVPTTAAGGMECLERVRDEDFDLILLDINMPDLDGWSVLRKLKEDGLTDRVKVMMITATTDIGTDIFGLQDVVHGYVRKPFNNRELADRLQEAFDTTAEAETEEAKRLKFFRKAIEEDGREKARHSAKQFELRKGFGYIVKERRPRKSFEIFVDQVTHNVQGLCVTRQHPSIIRQRWELEKTPIIWLSNQLGRVYVNPTNIGILSDTIVRFVEKTEDSVVIIDGLEFLIVNNDFNRVLRMIHHVSEAVMEYKSRLLISVDPRALDPREMALLERNMEVIEDRDA